MGKGEGEKAVEKMSMYSIRNGIRGRWVTVRQVTTGYINYLLVLDTHTDNWSKPEKNMTKNF